jgi:hypothetical protein
VAYGVALLTVKDSVLLFVPPTFTTTVPAPTLEPLETLVTMLVALQEMGIAVAPLMVTVLVP